MKINFISAVAATYVYGWVKIPVIMYWLTMLLLGIMFFRSIRSYLKGDDK